VSFIEKAPSPLAPPKKKKRKSNEGDN